MRSNRLIITLILFTALIGPVLVTTGWLQYHRYATRERIERQLYLTQESTEVVTLTFAKTDIKKLLEWEHNREFEFQGQMYDVIDANETPDSITYRCIWDKAETRIKKQLNQLVAQSLENDTQHHSRQQQIQIQLLKLYFEPTFNWQSKADGIARINHSCCTPNYSQLFYSLDNPPPESC